MSYRTQGERGSIKKKKRSQIDPHGVSARHRNRSALAPTGTGLALKGTKGMKVSISKTKNNTLTGLLFPELRS